MAGMNTICHITSI